MLINVLDSQLRKVAMLSNDVPGLPNYYNDEFHDYLDQGATTHKFTVSKIINNKLQDYVQFLSHQSYFSFRKNGKDYLMSPASSQAVHETSTEISFVCVSLDRELMNEMANQLTNTASHNIQWYFDTMGLISRTQITIGINEVANLTRTISYDGQETKLSRLISVINNFNAEFEFITKLNNDGTLDSVTLNIYKENDGQNVQGVGTKRDDVRLSFGKNIEDVTVGVSDDGFFNACYMTGADGYSWKNYDFSYKNADGVEEFYKRKGSEIAYAPLSAQMFPSQLKTDRGDIWTSIDETTEYKNANDMWGYIVKKFKQYAYHQITYTVTPSATLLGQLIGDGRPLQKGDTVIIQDNNYIDINGTVGLILSARVSEIIESESNPENNQIVFSNYKKLKSQASADIQSIVSQLVDEATPYRSLIETTNGTQFKNGTGSTVLTARIYKGSSDTETVADNYVWTKDGNALATTQAITVNATDITDKSVYTFQATVGGKTVGTWSVTITNVNDGKQGLKGDPGSTGIPGQPGADGRTSYLHIAYATNATGTAGFDVSNSVGKTYIGQYTDFAANDSTDHSKYSWSLIKGDKGDKGDTGNDGVAGKNGVGINSITVTYAISSSSTVTPTTGWTSQVPTLVKGQYLWTKTLWTYTDNTSETGYSVSYIAKDGNNGTNGIAGKDGVGITATIITYAQSTSGTTAPSSGWTSSVPTVPAGQFLWTKTVWSYSDSTSETGYSVAMMGAKGDKGDQGIQGIQGVDGTQGIPGPKGADGKTQYTHIAYANSADGSKDFSTSDSNRTYIGMYVDFNINDSTTPSDYSWTLVKGADGTQGTPGKPGADGKTPYFHTAWSYNADGTDRFTTVYPNLNLLDGTKDFSGYWDHWGDWTDDGTYKGLAVKKQTGIWNGIRKGFTALKDGVYTFSAYIKASGDNANIRRYVELFDINRTQKRLDVNDVFMGNNFDWKRDSFTLNLKKGDTLNPRYEMAGSGTLWTAGHKWEQGSTATPYMPSKKEVTTADYPNFIGQRTDDTKADSTNPTEYTWSLIRGNDGKDGANGKDGRAGKDGVGIKTTVITYAISSSGTVTPTAGWNSQVPTLVKGQYLWTKTVWNYSDGTSESGYTVSYIAKDGNTGNDGIAGKDGTGIKTTTITYAAGTSGTVAPTSGWTSTVPTVAAGSYLWTKTVWTYTDNTSETGYSVAKMGNNGATGPQGAQGATGATGPAGTSVTITSQSVTYQTSTSGTTAPTGAWSSTIPRTPQGQYLWTKTVVNYSNSKSTTAYSVAYVGTDGKLGPQGPATGLTQSATEPTNKYAGMLWQYTGTSNITIGTTVILPQVQYIYDGSKWKMYALSVANLNADTLSAITANLGTVTAGMIKSYIDYTYYNNSATGIPAKAYLRIDANNVNQKIALQSPSGVDWGYIRQDLDGLTIFTDTQNAGSIGNASGRYVRAKYSGSGINFINSNNASVNANGDLDVATPYTGTGSLYFDGTNLVSSSPIIALNTITKSYSFNVGGIGITLSRTMSFVAVTFSGQASSNVTGSPTFNNQLPIGFRPISPDSIDYMIPGHTANNGYFYFNPDGSIRLMADISSGWYVRGKRMYMTSDPYPS